jgi:ABC-type sulfate transport system permease subunit
MTGTTWNINDSKQLQHEVIHRAAWKAGVMGALNFAALVLSIRLIVLVAVMGGIILSFQALQTADVYRAVALALYGALVLIPVIWLASTLRA